MLETVLNQRCADCAFTAGTEASKSQWTGMLAKLCVQAGVPFECHGPHEGHMCRGFYDAFSAKLKNGDYDRLPEWKRKVFVSLIDVLDDFRRDSEKGAPWSDEESGAKVMAATKLALAEVPNA